MNAPEENLEIIKEFAMFQGSTYLLFRGILSIGFLGFLIYTKRYITSSSQQRRRPRFGILITLIKMRDFS
ncbi:MAG: hypothetical protein A2Y65_01450 [Deltaproteobacteria bacterium RBG_13_52_11]|nr:MAG: hypothetical protein A2Y65_01450 [Deltaproteobacteria bacterium RBG_13_52_11]